MASMRAAAIPKPVTAAPAAPVDAAAAAVLDDDGGDSD
jgi:hypothetical protein